MAFLFLTPIFYIPNTVDLRITQERFFQITAILIISLFFGNIWMTLFVWLNVLLFALNGCEVGSQQVLSIFLTGMMFACARTFFRGRSILEFTKPMQLVALLSTIWMIFQSFGIDPIYIGAYSTGEIMHDTSFILRTGLLNLPAINSIYFVMVSSLMVFTSPIWLILGIPVLLSSSSASAMAFAFLVAFWSYHKINRFFVFVMVAMFVLFCFFSLNDFKVDKKTYVSRFETWHLILRKSLEYPLGYGPDSFRNYQRNKNFTFWSDENYTPMLREVVSKDQHVLKYYSADPGKRKERFEHSGIPKDINWWREAHNDYLQFFFEYGIFGIILLCGFFREIYDRFVLSNKNTEVLSLFSILCVFAIVSFTQFPFHLARIAAPFGILLGAYWSATDKPYLTLKEM